jgi:hypothetical protein
VHRAGLRRYSARPSHRETTIMAVEATIIPVYATTMPDKQLLFHFQFNKIARSATKIAS